MKSVARSSNLVTHFNNTLYTIMLSIFATSGIIAKLAVLNSKRSKNYKIQINFSFFSKINFILFLRF
jgi:uncharacterized membrane protein (GlpM family)